MKFRMHENSLFAILLRSPWWISIAIAGGIAAVVALLVPATLAVAAALPFLVIGSIADILTNFFKGCINIFKCYSKTW